MSTSTSTSNSIKPCSDVEFGSSPLTILFAKYIIHGPATQPPTCDGIVVMKDGIIQYVGKQGTKEANEYIQLLAAEATKGKGDEDDGADVDVDDDREKKEVAGRDVSTTTTAAASKNETLLVYHVHTIMPGMWDVHTHFFGGISRKATLYENQWKWIFEDRAVKVGRDVPRCKRILDSGFTSVREVGGLGKHLKVLIQEGSIYGPRIYHANTPIHITGGHCDFPSDVPLSCVGALCNIIDADENGGILTKGVDGPIDCCKQVRQNIREGASVIKICCSGGVLSNNAGMPTQQQFSGEEIKAMTEEATRHDRIVCAHCHSQKGIVNAIQNGVTCIEHCTLATDETVLDMIKEKDILVVPTRWVIENLIPSTGIDGPKPNGMSDVSWKKLQMIYTTSKEVHAKLIQKGIKIATGCDIFVSEGYGTSSKELQYLVELGMTSEQAIEAATANGPLSLGSMGMAPLSGQIKKGYDADILGLSTNPLVDSRGVSVLQEYDTTIQLVIKGGIIQKNILYS